MRLGGRSLKGGPLVTPAYDGPAKDSVEVVVQPTDQPV